MCNLILMFESFRYQEKSATKGFDFSRVQRVSLLICRCMVDWWFRSFSFISILIQKISLRISLVILSMTFIWHPDDRSNVYMVVLVDLFIMFFFSSSIFGLFPPTCMKGSKLKALCSNYEIMPNYAKFELFILIFQK